MLAACLLTYAWTIQYASVSTYGRAASVHMDADRCYYGTIDEDGGVVKRESRNVRSGPAPTPNPSLSPLEVVDAQFEALARGSFAGVKEAYQFISPTMIERYNIDENKFKAVLDGDAFDGLIGVAEWAVTDIVQPSDDVAVIKLRVLPKPVAGCVRTSGVANQAGITWPTYYKWVLGKVPSDAAEHAGCWMLDNMQPEAPPMDVSAREGPEALEAQTTGARAAPPSMSLASRPRRVAAPRMMAEAYSTLTCGDRKVMFNQAMGKGLGTNPRHTQLPMGAQSFINEMITSEGIAMNSKKYRYSRTFAVGFNALCDIFLSAGIQESSAKIARDSLVIAYGFEPKTVYADSAALLAAAEGKSEEEVLQLKDLKDLAASDTQYSYALGAGLIALMKECGVEPSDEAIVRWCGALNIKSVNSFKRDLGYFKMNVEKFQGMREMFKQMEDAAKKREAEREKEIAEKGAPSKPSDKMVN